ncbi:MAG: hypothetical protein KF855_13755 [Acidobacteria bacterium]|nr:hypothetical protein [Acidobacteriota bacterium]
MFRLTKISIGRYLYRHSLSHVGRFPRQIYLCFLGLIVVASFFADATAQSSDQSERGLDFPFEIVERMENKQRTLSSATIYIYMDERNFSKDNLTKLFRHLGSKEKTSFLTIIVFTDKEMLGWKIKRDKHPLLPNLMTSEEGQKIIDEKYSEYFPPDIGYFRAEFTSTNHRTRFLYTPDKEADHLIEVRMSKGN